MLDIMANVTFFKLFVEDKIVNCPSEFEVYYSIGELGYAACKAIF